MAEGRNPAEEAESGRILAVDLGSRRIGLAVSDPLGIIAQPVPTLKAETWEADVEAVARIAADRGAKAIVVGLPLRMNGKAGKEAQRAERFADALRQQTGLAIHTWDERLTTLASEKALIEAGHRRKKRRAMIDSTASILILQGFLDFVRNQPPS